MEDLVLPPPQKQTVQSSRKCAPRSKDLWLVVKEGSVSDVDLALSFLKKNGGNINARNPFGLTPLHIATWRNHTPVVRRLLEAGADPNARVHFASHLFDLLICCNVRNVYRSLNGSSIINYLTKIYIEFDLAFSM